MGLVLMGGQYLRLAFANDAGKAIPAGAGRWIQYQIMLAVHLKTNRWIVLQYVQLAALIRTVKLQPDLALPYLVAKIDRHHIGPLTIA